VAIDDETRDQFGSGGRQILEPVMVIDGHNDLPWAHRTAAGYDLGAVDVGMAQPQFNTDLPRLRRGSVGGQFWSVYVPVELSGSEAVRATLEQIEFVHRLVETYPDTLELVSTAAEAEAAMARGRIASFLGAEGGHSIDESLQVLRIFYRLGVRYMTLTHSRNVAWADSCTDEPNVRGLSEFGRTVVGEMNRLGMLVDVSHVSSDTARAALQVSQAPVIFSHSSCLALCDHPRNAPDDVLATLKQNGGVVMITFVPNFVSQSCADWEVGLKAELARRELPSQGAEGEQFTAEWEAGHPRPKATLAEVADHVDHAREVAGVDHVGIGGDFDGCPHFPVGLEDVSCYPHLFGLLTERGWSEAELRQLGSGNLLRALSGAERVAAGLRGDQVAPSV
jgi:membrane dipeptidase